MQREQYAPAKLTWLLRILGSRADGFHELEALASVVSEPGDRLTIEPADAISLVVSGVDDDVPSDATNLAWKAAAAAGVTVAMTLEKQIPAGAGLGGGSSDAAAVLRALRDGPHLDAPRASEIAAGLGSDVPVCLHGGTAWMRGRGEMVEPVEAVRPTPLVIAVPPVQSSTPAVYRAWDELGGPRSSRTVPAPPSVAHLVDELVNDLEPAAARVEPRLGTFREELEAVLGRPVLMAGSGSAFFAWFDDPGEARAGARKAGEELGVATFDGIAG